MQNVTSKRKKSSMVSRIVKMMIAAAILNKVIYNRLVYIALIVASRVLVVLLQFLKVEVTVLRKTTIIEKIRTLIGIIIIRRATKIY